MTDRQTQSRIYLLHFQLGLALAYDGVITLLTYLVAQHIDSLPAYAFIAQDLTTQAALYTPITNT